VLFAWPDTETESNFYEIAIPKLGSFVLTHEWDGEVRGLKSFPPEDRPNPIIPFFAFRIMVGIGFLMIALGITGAVLWLMGRLYTTRWYLQAMAWSFPIGFIAVLAGWFVAEVGRQPWVVYNVLRTADAVSPVPGGSVLTTLVLFFVVYGIIFGAGIYYIAQLVRRGPGEIPPVPDAGEGDPSRRPMAAGGAP
jgi:cytochrome d ubiquinol oxidase subunit I